MSEWPAALDASLDSNDPFGISRFSIRRYSVQHFLLIILANLLLVAMTALAAFQGNAPLLALSAVTLAVVLLKTMLVVRIGLRTIAVEAWIRRLAWGISSTVSNPGATMKCPRPAWRWRPCARIASRPCSWTW